MDTGTSQRVAPSLAPWDARDTWQIQSPEKKNKTGKRDYVRCFGVRFPRTNNGKGLFGSGEALRAMAGQGLN